MANTFTDRIELRDAFWNHYKKKPDGSITVMTFCGTGGVGKSALLEKLEEEIRLNSYGREKYKFLSYDFSDGNKTNKRDVLGVFRTVLSEYNCTFPLFDAGNYYYSRKIGQDVALPEVKPILQNIRYIGNIFRGLSKFERGLGTVYPIVNIAAMVFLGTKNPLSFVWNAVRFFTASTSLIDKGLIKYMQRTKVWDDEHKEIYNQLLDLRKKATPNELRDYLPTLFATDVKDWLQATGNKLVVFLDNYESLTGATTSQTSEQFKSHSWLSGDEGLILKIPNTLWVIAGRELHWKGKFAEKAEKYFVETLSPEYSNELLKKKGIGNENLRGELVKLTDGYPIFLDLCAKFYVRYKSQHNAEPTIDEFGETREDVVGRIFRYIDKNREDAAKDMLEFFCVLNVWTDELAVDIGNGILSNFFRNTYKRIKKFSIIKSEQLKKDKIELTVYRFDKTIQSILIAQIVADPDGQKLIADVKKALDEHFKKFFAGKKKFDAREKFYLKLWANFTVRFVDDPETLRKECTENLSKHINTLTNRADFDTAEEILTVFMNKLENLGATDSVSYAYFERRLSALRQEQGNFDEARKLAMSSYEKRVRYLGERHPATLSSMNTLANSLDRLGRYEDLLVYRKKVLTLRTEILGENNLKTVDAMSNYAVALSRQRRFYEALNQQVKVYLFYKENFGESEKKTLDALGNIAWTLSYLGRDNEALIYEALQYRREVFSLSQKEFGYRNGRTVRAMINLAFSLNDLGRHEEALELQEKVLALRTEMFREDNPQTIKAMSDLAFTLSNLGRYDEAEQRQQRILQLCKNNFGDNDQRTLIAMQNLSSTLKQLNKYEEAVPLQEKILALQKRKHGERNIKTIDAMNDLAKTLAILNRHEEALELQEKVLDLRTKVFGEQDIKTINAMNDLAKTLAILNRHEEEVALQE